MCVNDLDHFLAYETVSANGEYDKIVWLFYPAASVEKERGAFLWRFGNRWKFQARPPFWWDGFGYDTPANGFFLRWGKRTFFWLKRRIMNLKKEGLHKTFVTVLEDLYAEESTRILEAALCKLAADPVVLEQVPQAGGYAKDLKTACLHQDQEEREFALMELYRSLHGGGWHYEDAEEGLLAARKGHRNLPGGLLPLLLARHLMERGTVTADLGAGNGLQGLLMQMLCPHQKTVQVELSASLISVGKHYQKVLEIPEERVDWQHGDIGACSLDTVDLVYLYRPVRPAGDGLKLYATIGAAIAKRKRGTRIISVADCLGRFLDPRFLVLYENEFLTIYSDDEENL